MVILQAFSYVNHIKVSKSQKPFLESSILPKKTKGRLEKTILRAPWLIFFSCFVRFLEELIIPKIAFEIY